MTHWVTQWLTAKKGSSMLKTWHYKKKKNFHQPRMKVALTFLKIKIILCQSPRTQIFQMAPIQSLRTRINASQSTTIRDLVRCLIVFPFFLQHHPPFHCHCPKHHYHNFLWLIGVVNVTMNCCIWNELMFKKESMIKVSQLKDFPLLTTFFVEKGGLKIWCITTKPCTSTIGKRVPLRGAGLWPKG